MKRFLAGRLGITGPFYPLGISHFNPAQEKIGSLCSFLINFNQCFWRLPINSVNLLNQLFFFSICQVISSAQKTLSMFILTQWPPHSIYVILFSWKVKLKVKMSGYKSRSLAAVHKTHTKKKERKIGQYPAILTLKWSITRMEYEWEWVRINLLKIMALLKLLQIRTLFMNHILQ